MTSSGYPGRPPGPGRVSSRGWGSGFSQGPLPCVSQVAIICQPVWCELPSSVHSRQNQRKFLIRSSNLVCNSINRVYCHLFAFSSQFRTFLVFWCFLWLFFSSSTSTIYLYILNFRGTHEYYHHVCMHETALYHHHSPLETKGSGRHRDHHSAILHHFTITPQPSRVFCLRSTPSKFHWKRRGYLPQERSY